MISQYFIGRRPISLRDEFPTQRNLSVSFSGLNDLLAMGDIVKRFAANGDDMRFANSESRFGLNWTGLDGSVLLC